MGGERSYRPRFMRPHGCNGTLCETWGPNKRAFVLPLKKEERGEGGELEHVEWKTFPRTNRIYRSRCLVLRSESWPCSRPFCRFCSARSFVSRADFPESNFVLASDLIMNLKGIG